MQFENDFKEMFQHFQFKSTTSIDIQTKIINSDMPDDRQLVSSLILTLYRKENNILQIEIVNFETFNKFGNVTYRNQGYGTQLLNYTIEELKPYLKEYNLKIKEIRGKLIKRDKNYWKISLPMYYKFSKKLLEQRPCLFFNSKRIYIKFLKLVLKQFQHSYEEVNFSFKS